MKLHSDKFDWDKGNITKSAKKHGIYAIEAMSVFLSTEFVLYKNINILTENRYIYIAKSKANRLLTTVYTLRNGKIRIISSRRSNKKETQEYKKVHG